MRIVRFVVLGALLAAGCKDAGSEPSGPVELSVFAASSLTEAFQEMERGFEAAHPGVDVRLTFAGSQVLRLQIEQGADADVFASADELHLRELVDGGYVAESRTFAHNELVVIVPAGAAGITRFEDLDKAARIVIGAENVPVGTYTRQLLERAGAQLGEAFVSAVRQHVVSEESNVRLVRAKVEMGEADAAVVYRTDATSSDRIRVVPIPEASSVRASYPIGALVRSRHPKEAAAFLDYVLSPEGSATLARHGFLSAAR